MLHLQCFGLLPRDAAGAADGVFDLDKGSSVSLMLRGYRREGRVRTWRPFMTCCDRVESSDELMWPSAREVNIFQMDRRAVASRSG